MCAICVVPASAQSFPAAVIVGVVFVRRLSPLKFTIIKTKETAQEAVSLWPALQGSAQLQGEVVCPSGVVMLGRQSQAFPGAGCRRKGCHITPLLPAQARLLWSGTEVGLSGCLRNNQVYQLRGAALGLRSSLPAARLPRAVHWLLSLDTLGPAMTRTCFGKP